MDRQGLHAHLDTLDALRGTYASYRLAYSKLVLELDRRTRYSAAAEQLLIGALQTLDTMREGTVLLPFLSSFASCALSSSFPARCLHAPAPYSGVYYRFSLFSSVHIGSDLCLTMAPFLVG